MPDRPAQAAVVRLLAGLACFASGLVAAQGATQVPFVGCPSEGQLGPIAAPRGAPKTVDVAAAAARQLAYYQAQDGFGTLAPRGWRCLYFYGSSGASLLIAPNARLAEAATARLSGPAVVETVDVGSTSGRFDVAKYAARLFAEREKAFIAGVIAEGVAPAADFPSGPWPADALTYKSATLVEFTTPAHRDGLGASDRLQTNGEPIYGMAEIQHSGDGPNLILTTVRLPPQLVGLEKALVAYPE